VPPREKSNRTRRSEAHTVAQGAPMKAGELKKQLAAVPDFYEVLMDFGDSNLLEPPKPITEVIVDPSEAEALLYSE
jgi:hypothetical protein